MTITLAPSQAAPSKSNLPSYASFASSVTITFRDHNPPPSAGRAIQIQPPLLHLRIRDHHRRRLRRCPLHPDSNFNPKPSTLSSRPYTLNPETRTLNREA